MANARTGFRGLGISCLETHGRLRHSIGPPSSSTPRAKDLPELLARFADLRRSNLAALVGMNLTEEDFSRQGMHPELGEVTLRQLLATWVVHDLDHVGQIARTMAKAYGEATGPWAAYLSILRDRV